MKIEGISVDTDCAAAQEAKRLRIAALDTIDLAIGEGRNKETLQAMWAAQREVKDHVEKTRWMYSQSGYQTHRYWTWYPQENVEVIIYDREEQS
ncbi:hypothetical protein [Kocuria carniphila]|uniref:hypothetical protein n=1 Tax=Kocuria carniphila TaxID=262208 RepID=UPI0034CD19E6